ncbi:Aste57867_24571 [Aphanomyces stellatus]|uniref:Aste57867_24571 protein n=1 Tax=Aphanomyces stellatus TaxID=120398 RepID=A0A485LV34_9STRA|nr:hypothetical protein As57867_024493 [Aphanomyces stellatus]VFU01210.1 Aste57867_24571 [Aphanomyces stellatus]
MAAVDTKMNPNFSNLLQLQHRGYAQLLQTFDGRVNEHESLSGMHPISGKVGPDTEQSPHGCTLVSTRILHDSYRVDPGLIASCQISNKRKRAETPVGLGPGTPMNTLEETLLASIDADSILLDLPATDRFLPLFHQAKTESDQAKLLFVLATTAKRADKASSVEAFESFGGMKIARQWLDTAVSYRQHTLLHYILITLKELPLQLASITDARINEPIVQLRKTAANEHVKRAAQDLLKHWKTTFTEKPKESSSPPSKPKQTSSSTAAAASSKSGSDLLGKLLEKKKLDAKQASVTKPKDSFITKMVQNHNIKKQQEAAAVVSSPKEVALPTIARFDQVQSQPAATSNTRRIRWADEHGAELTKIKLIDSWRDTILHSDRDDDPSSPTTGHSFKDAKLREHANEKFAFLNKSKERKKVEPTMPWRTPPTIAFPEGVTARPMELDTNESMAQTNRTRKDVEWMILGDEVPPPNPQEWSRTPADLTLGPAAPIPLSDGDELSSAAPVGGPSAAAVDNIGLTRDLGPLEKSTIALLLQNEHVLGQVYDEAQRNGRRISDQRVLEIIHMGNRGGGAPLLSNPPPLLSKPKAPLLSAPPLNAAPLLSNPPPVGGYGGGGYGYSGGPSSGGGYNGAPPPHTTGGYGGPPSGYKPPPQGGGYGGPSQGYGGGSNGYGPPPSNGGYGPPGGGGYGGGYGYQDDNNRKPFNKRPAGGLLHEPGYPSKRPAPGPPMGGGGPPSGGPISTYKYKQVPCIYFSSPAGCGKGDACTFIHDGDARSGGGGGEPKPSKYAPRAGGPMKGPKPSHYGGGGRGGGYR